MAMYKYFPVPSDRMGTLWTLTNIQNAVILEFGPSGNTSFETMGFFHLNTTPSARIFTTHINETDITFGQPDRLIRGIKEISRRYHPEVIFILASSLSGVTGMDIEGICFEIAGEIDADLLVMDSGGFRGDYTYGIRQTMKRLCSDVVRPFSGKSPDKKRYNILGSQADCFNFQSDIKEVQRLMKTYFDLDCAAVLTSSTTLNEIQQASGATFNVVMRSEALDAAAIMEGKWHQASVSAMLYGKKATLAFLEKVAAITEIDISTKRLEPEIQAADHALELVHTLAEHSPTENRILVSGNRDAVMGMGVMLKEMGFQKSTGMINHEVTGVSHEFSNGHEQLEINPSETRKQELINTLQPNIILGDGVAIDMVARNKEPFCYQVANPNIHHISIFDKTPYIGFNGVIHLCETLCNGLMTKRGKSFPLGH